MRKYGLVLSALCLIQCAHPKEQSTWQMRTQRIMHALKKKYLKPVTTYIHRQYHDKHRRRAWLSAGIICIVFWLSWQSRVINKFIYKKTGSKQPGKLTPEFSKITENNGNSTTENTLPEQKKEINASDVIINQVGKKDRFVTHLPKEEEERERWDGLNKSWEKDTQEAQEDGGFVNQTGTMCKKSEQNIKEEEETKKILNECAKKAKQIKNLRSQIKKHEESSSTVRIHSASSSSSSSHKSDIQDAKKLLKQRKLEQKRSKEQKQSILWLGAEALQACLKKVGCKIDTSRLCKDPDLHDTAYIIPALRTQYAITKDLESAKQNVKKELTSMHTNQKNTLIDNTLEKAAQIIMKQNNAQNNLEAAAKAGNFDLMITSLINGATVEDESFAQSLFAYVDKEIYNKLSQDQKTAFDCILWQMGLPIEAKNALWQRTIRSGVPPYPTIPSNFFT